MVYILLQALDLIVEDRYLKQLVFWSRGNLIILIYNRISCWDIIIWLCHQEEAHNQMPQEDKTWVRKKKQHESPLTADIMKFLVGQWCENVKAFPLTWGTSYLPLHSPWQKEPSHLVYLRPLVWIYCSGPPTRWPERCPIPRGMWSKRGNAADPGCSISWSATEAYGWVVLGRICGRKGWIRSNSNITRQSPEVWEESYVLFHQPLYWCFGFATWPQQKMNSPAWYGTPSDYENGP